MLFKYLEEVKMPNLNHCIDCDKPMQPANSKGLCDNCYHKATRLFGGDTGIDADWEMGTDELALREMDEKDYEPTTADKYNKEWLDEQEKRTKTKTKTQQS